MVRSSMWPAVVSNFFAPSRIAFDVVGPVVELVKKVAELVRDLREHALLHDDEIPLLELAVLIWRRKRRRAVGRSSRSMRMRAHAGMSSERLRGASAYAVVQERETTAECTRALARFQPRNFATRERKPRKMRCLRGGPSYDVSVATLRDAPIGCATPTSSRARSVGDPAPTGLPGTLRDSKTSFKF